MWSDSMKDDLVRAMKDPFDIKVVESKRSSSSRDREMSKETFINRIRPQVKEMEDAGLSWSTPEEWDQSFQILGGGSTRRTSSAILARMSWKEFLSLISKSD